ncbi:MAG TPA: gluconate 2-dehydrogenase subunit 3 family protein [Steroidobacter sp.]|uniref:gluconate 2-dehydrogenase subunit 3 family protein n=1 Tax=Steroidobacter sp. TaxID=1978227 RepID=UPI002ED7EB97
MRIDQTFDRRELLRRAILLVGGTAIAAPVELFADSGAKARFFGPAEYSLLEVVADIIMPRTDTPGAIDAGVPLAFDALMKNWASRERQEQFRALLKEIDQAAREQGNGLLALEDTRRAEVLVAFDKSKNGDRVYRKFKELVLTLYYHSEVGATQELRYEHVPGRWEASVKMTPETRAWAV